jgi:hypothetical protein
MKKKTKRSREKYPALKPELNLKTRSELIDYDYIDKLSEKDKKWLNQFTEEYTNASLNTKNSRKNLHKTKKLKKDCYDRNNARNRCILTRANATGMIESYDELKKQINLEDDLIEKLDSEKLDKLKNDPDKT